MSGTGDTSVRSYNFFVDRTIANVAYVVGSPDVFIDTTSGINFTSHTIMFSSDGGGTLFFSFDGANDHGKILINEALQQDFRRVKQIWFRKDTADVPLRFWSW